jgi:hypothetical protein
VADVTVRASAGVVTVIEGTWVVVLDDGGRITPLWPLGVTPADGDRVQVVIVDGVGHVLGPVAPNPCPATGTIAGAASSGRVPVTTAFGTVQARYTGTAPSIGTLVALLWHGTTPMLLPGTLAPLPTDPQPAPPTTTPTQPPGGPSSGSLPIAAAGSGTWRTGSWGWATSPDVLQGSWSGGQENRGGWWYGDAPRAVGGRRITGGHIRLPARLRVGNYNDAGVLHLWLTTNPSRPGADFNRVAGPLDVVLAPNAGPQLVQISAGWGQALADNGGGIAITGSPYLGLVGVGAPQDGKDPESGHLTLNWAR